MFTISTDILTWKKHRKLKCPHNPFCCCLLFKLWVLLAEEKSGLPFGGGDSMKHPPWLFRWDFLLCFPFFQDVLRESRYLATGFCYNKYRKLKKWAIHSFLVISHVGRNIILRTSDSATLLSLKHYFQRNECPGPDCISDFLFGFGWETEPRGLFVLTGHIRNSQTVYNSPHGHTESAGSVGTFRNKSWRLWLGPSQFSTLGLWTLSPGLTKPEPGEWHYEAEASPGLPKPMFEIFFFKSCQGAFLLLNLIHSIPKAL